MTDLTFRSRAAARQYFTKIQDAARLATVEVDYAHLPDRVPARGPYVRRPVADVLTQPYQPKPPR